MESMEKIKKAKIKGDVSRRVGMFATKKGLYEIGSIVSVSEPYCDIYDRLGSSYGDLLCKEYRLEISELSYISGWTNSRHTKAHLMPRRVRLVESKVSRVMNISDEEWALLGASDDEQSRIDVVGQDAWLWNTYLKLYRYELITNNAFRNECTED